MNKVDIPDKGKRKRIIIVGGGFGGLKLARKLKNDIFQQQSVIDFSGCANWMDRYNFRRPPHTGYNLQ